jgi:hypothetical protein
VPPTSTRLAGQRTGQASQVTEDASASRGRETGVQVSHGVPADPADGKLRRDQHGHGQNGLPVAGLPGGVPPQRLEGMDQEPDDGAAGYQPGQHQQASQQQPRLRPRQAENRPQPRSLRPHRDARPADATGTTDTAGKRRGRRRTALRGGHRAAAAWESSR